MSYDSSQTVSSVHPVNKEFWEEFRVGLGDQIFQTSKGFYYICAVRAKQLALMVKTYMEHRDKDMLTKFADEIKKMDDNTRFLNFGLYRSINLGYKRIGLADLRQFTLFTDPHGSGEVGMYCSGFSEPIPLDIYYAWKNTCYEDIIGPIVTINTILQMLIENQTRKIPEEFTQDDELDYD